MIFLHLLDDDATMQSGLNSFGHLDSAHRDFGKEKRVIREGDGSTAAANNNWSSEPVSRPEEVDEESRTRSFYFRQDTYTISQNGRQ